MELEIRRTWEFNENDVNERFLYPAKINIGKWLMNNNLWDGRVSIQEAIDTCNMPLEEIIEAALTLLKKEMGTDYTYMWDRTGPDDVYPRHFNVYEYQIVPESAEDLWEFVRKYTIFHK